MIKLKQIVQRVVGVFTGALNIGLVALVVVGPLLLNSVLMASGHLIIGLLFFCFVLIPIWVYAFNYME